MFQGAAPAADAARPKPESARKILSHKNPTKISYIKSQKTFGTFQYKAPLLSC